MPRPDLTLGRYAAICVLFAAPMMAAVLVLIGLDQIRAGPALIALAAATAGIALAVRFYYRDAIRIADYLGQLEDTEGRAGRPPRTESELGRAFGSRITRLHRDWHRRNVAQQAELEAASGLIEALVDPLIVVERNRLVGRANDAAIRLFGDRLIGRDLAESVRHPTVLTAVEDVLTGGQAKTVEFSRPVPIEQVFLARVQPLAPPHPGEDDPESEVETPPRRPLALLTLQDITAMRRSEQMRADFVANASHELRTPLSTLIGFIETLRGPARDDELARERFLAIMDEQAGRMSRLVADLLSLSRIELDEHTAPAGRVELPTVLRGVIDTLELKASRRGMSLELDFTDMLPPVMGDPDQLTQVFQNLVDNAINYGREETAVTITATPTDAPAISRDGAVSVSVVDRSDGIPRSHIPRLTERFYRVDAARSRALGGTGLGLAIVKHIVSRHRGRLVIDSEVGQGSTFTVLLPVAAQPADAEHEAPVPATSLSR